MWYSIWTYPGLQAVLPHARGPQDQDPDRGVGSALAHLAHEPEQTARDFLGLSRQETQASQRCRRLRNDIGEVRSGFIWAWELSPVPKACSVADREEKDVATVNDRQTRGTRDKDRQAGAAPTKYRGRARRSCMCQGGAVGSPELARLA